MDVAHSETHDIYWVFTQDQATLDRIVVYRNSVAGRLIHHPSIKRFDVSDMTVGDWAFQWIATLDYDNHGILVLKPTNRRTKQLAVVGKAVYLINSYGVDADTAVKLVQASWGVRHASHDDVIGLVVETLKEGDWDGYEEHPMNWVKEKLNRTDNGWDRMRSLHLNKIGSAYDVVRHYHEITDGKRRPPPFPDNLLRLALEDKI